MILRLAHPSPLFIFALAFAGCGAPSSEPDAGTPQADANDTSRDSPRGDASFEVSAEQDASSAETNAPSDIATDLVASDGSTLDRAPNQDAPDGAPTPEASSDTVVRDGSSSIAEASADADASIDADRVDAGRDGTGPDRDVVTDALICGPEPAPRCAPVRHVASLADLTDIINKNLSWQSASLGQGRPLTISDDLVADVDLQLGPSDIVPPSNCGTLDGGCPRSFFRESLYPRTDGTGRVAGLTCLAPEPVVPRRAVACGGMAITQGTTFRIRKVHQFSMWGIGLFVELDRPCTAVCNADETRCDVNQTCFHRGFESCSWCEGAPLAVCGCRDTCGGAMGDGARCEYDEADDVYAVGTCLDGKCCQGAGCPDH